MSSSIDADADLYRTAFYSTTFTLSTSGNYQYLGFLDPTQFIENQAGLLPVTADRDCDAWRQLSWDYAWCLRDPALER